jgi:alpha-tubulin suppressor-like RCC1 family protein
VYQSPALGIKTINSVIQVAMGNDHTCALLKNGNVRCWGKNEKGELGLGNINILGDNETITSVPPIKFPIGFKIKQLTAGNRHTCALSEEGKVICWGNNSSGQLGYGDATDRGNTPETTPEKIGFVGIQPVRTIVSGTGANHTCAILVSGEAKCWGFNFRGQLGIGNKNNIGDQPNELEQLAPIQLGTSSVRQIAVGANHTCALLRDNTLRCWGENFLGQLGYGTTANFGSSPGNFGDETGEVPSSRQVPINDAAQIALGLNHTCVITATQKVRCWGQGFGGQLGYGNLNSIGDNELPATSGFVSIGADVKQISVGGDSQNVYGYTCVLQTDSNIKCWGHIASGQGNPNIGDNELPSSVSPVQINSDATQGKVTRIFSGGQSACVLFESGNTKCFGDNGFGQLGYGSTTGFGDSKTPSSVGIVPLF